MLCVCYDSKLVALLFLARLITGVGATRPVKPSQAQSIPVHTIHHLSVPTTMQSSDSPVCCASAK